MVCNMYLPISVAQHRPMQGMGHMGIRLATNTVLVATHTQACMPANTDSVMATLELESFNSV